MNERKLICCIMNCPENIYQQRIMDGLLARCERYGYDLAVFIEGKTMREVAFFVAEKLPATVSGFLYTISSHFGNRQAFE